MDVQTVRLTIDSDPGEVRQVRRKLSDLVGESPLSAEEWYQVKVCIAEAVNNAIIHAYGRYIMHQVMDCVEYASAGGRNELVPTRLARREAAGTKS